MDSMKIQAVRSGALAVAAAAALTACGGGGSVGDDGVDVGTTGTGYVMWTNSANGNVIVDADNEEFRIDSSSRRVEDRSGRQATALSVDSDAKVIDNGRQVGTVQLVNGTGGTRIAAFRCSDGSAMDITFRADNTYTYGCAGTGTSSGSTGGTGATGGSSVSTSYSPFTGSANGTVVLDNDNERFQVDSVTRLVVDRSGVQLAGLTVDTAGTVAWNGTVIGSVVLASGTNGSTVAVFQCRNGSRMDLTVSVTAWTYACQSGSSGSTGGSGSGSGGSSARTFITWTGSSNGELVLDASNDAFKFNSVTRCLYSQNRDVEYGNFCLSGTNTVVFSGSTYTVSKVRSDTNSCIVALTTSAGNFADIVTGTDRIDTISDSGRRPQAC